MLSPTATDGGDEAFGSAVPLRRPWRLRVSIQALLIATLVVSSI